MYCHGSQTKANACKEAYTSRMKVCTDEAKARRAVEQKHEYVDSKDRKFNENKKGNRLC